MARQRPEKKREPQAAAVTKIRPIDLRVRDRLTDESSEWEIIGRPYTTAFGKTANVRLQRVGQQGVTHLRTWGEPEEGKR